MSRRGYVCNAATGISRETFLFPSLIQAVGEGLDLSVTMMPKRISEDARFSVVGVSLSLLTSIGRHQIRRSCCHFLPGRRAIGILYVMQTIQSCAAV